MGSTKAISEQSCRTVIVDRLDVWWDFLFLATWPPHKVVTIVRIRQLFVRTPFAYLYA